MEGYDIPVSFGSTKPSFRSSSNSLTREDDDLERTSNLEKRKLRKQRKLRKLRKQRFESMQGDENDQSEEEDDDDEDHEEDNDEEEGKDKKNQKKEHPHSLTTPFVGGSSCSANDAFAAYMRDELGLSDSEEEEDKEDTSRDTSKKTDSRGPVFVSSSHSKKNENPIETEGDNDGEESQDIYTMYGLPITEELVLRGHDRTVTALGLDPAGSRLCTGGADYDVCLYDFHGLNNERTPFRKLDQPCEQYPINQVQFSTRGDLLLVCPDFKAPRLFNRDGHRILEFVKGDMYLVDMKKTNGHIAAVTGCQWLPHDRNLVATCSLDSTIRIWNIDSCARRQEELILLKNAQNKRVQVSSMAIDKNLRFIAGGANDGSIQIFPYDGPYPRPVHLIRNAHDRDCDVSCIEFSSDSKHLISRSMDNTLKVWDLRRLERPLAVFGDLDNLYSQLDCAFSPDCKTICTLSTPEKGEDALLHFFSMDSLTEIHRVPVYNGSACRLNWHHALNQILVGCSDGQTRILYHPSLSRNGAIAAVSVNRSRRVDVGYMNIQPVIVNPLDRRRNRGTKIAFDGSDKKTFKQRMKERQDPVLTKKPDAPVEGNRGTGGKLVRASMSAFLIDQFDLVMKETDEFEENPRDALVKYGDLRKEPLLTGVSYENEMYDFDLLQREREEEEKKQIHALKRQKTS